MRYFLIVAAVAAFLPVTIPAAQAGIEPAGGKSAPLILSQQTDPPLKLEADMLTFEAGGKRTVARGAAEIRFGQFALSADEITFEEDANTLIAKGNARLTRPDGTITRADVLEAPPEMRDAFARLQQR